MPDSATLLDCFRRDRARGTNDDIDLTLRPAFLGLLAKLGDPHLKIPPVFHVAGTNGKGSVCAFLRAILEAAGYRVHVYTSPHLVRFHERIRIAGELISETELVAALTLCRNLSEPGSITYFEAATAVAFKVFAGHPADYTILEVGLGGRLDATNVIPEPLASIITRLSFDHRDYLGAAMKEIAREKAGIIKYGVPCFSAAQPETGALEILREVAGAVHAPLFVAGKDWDIEKSGSGFCYREKTESLDLPTPALIGGHQYDNAGLAIAAIRGVQGSGLRVQQEAIAQGLRNVIWPARLQRIEKGRLAELLPEHFELWLDGGHNDSAGEVLAHQARIWGATNPMPLHVICGMLTTKYPAEFLSPLMPYAASVQTVVIPHEVASFTAEGLAATIQRATGKQNVTVAKNIEHALKNLVLSSPNRILICGSLYLAGQVLQQNTDDR